MKKFTIEVDIEELLKGLKDPPIKDPFDLLANDKTKKNNKNNF